ncbi:unnamed protein product (macronuclear) [Paramecium tetraurelia]|uniref:EGF-like domain-containing protein n=1 Tax=Paramecium tetraurelia TaxID=5888 RepID=A0BK02_PARTE|nr:uncharacterized protein GSPATT00029499001 [Paramecium tetraurelia]CAK58869.1 unnamed protein product [Paramecium tetraurelia]|eukprot:XP_001426267.1 hypothetical protein (macronuclear) [Paramecium tetraurelia strain d4-2]
MTLYYEAFTDPSFITSEDWVLQNALSTYSDCSGTRILGGYNAFGYQAKAMKLLLLPPHYMIYITMQFWKIDSWDGEILYIYLDGTLSYTAQYSISGVQQCGATWGDEMYSLTITQPHVFQSVVILITTNLSSLPNDESWGFREFKLYLDLCPPGCKSCQAKDSILECRSWTLASSAFLSDQLPTFKTEGWSITNGIQDTTVCSSIPIFGGYGKCGASSVITGTISMPQHYLIKIRFRIAYMDSWDTEKLYFYADGNLIFQKSHNYNAGGFRSYCGSNTYDDYLPNYEIIMFHTKESLVITFTSTLNEGFTNESLGIRDFEIFTYDWEDCGNGMKESQEQCDDGNIYAFDGCFNCEYSCVEGCSNCIDGICFECDIGWIFYSDFNTCIPIVDDTQYQIWEECDDTLQYEICLNGKFFCPSNCKSCQFGICLQCKLNYELINNRCESICQNQLILNDIQCTDYNLQPFDKCHQCYYDLQQGCQLQSNGFCIQCLNGWILDINQNICIPICGDLIILGDEQCDINKYTKSSFGCNQCEFDCQYECTDCQFGKCYDCIPGWKLKNYQCESDCGNKSIQGQEECDDMNSIRFDGCNNCRNDCQRECSYCQKGICLDCIYGWHLTDHFICEAECGDNLIALISYEECEDSNYVQFDGCYQCKMECCHYCDVCVYGYCYNCEYTFTLIDQYCIPVCGDGLVTVGYEQCDDMNEMPYDGCYNCNYQCREHCKLCIKGICQDKCQYGYDEVDYECLPRCGDGIIVEEEDCDDQNDDLSDGCYKCKFHCPDHCEICDQGKCKLCEQGFELNVILNQCLTYCGNGMVSQQEECDDMNKEDGDGCSRFCKIESDYQCRNQELSFSQCTYSKQPRFYLQFKEERDQKQYVSLLFTQQVKYLNQDLYSKYIQMNLIDIDIDIYQLNLIVIQEPVEYPKNVEYIIEIQINQTLSIRPYLEVTLDEQLYNSEDNTLFNQYDKIQLKQPRYIDDQKQEAAATLNQANKYLMNSVGGIGILAFFLGNSFIFSSILEVLQQQSYLRFINVVFPFNLFIYFEASNIITMKPILQFFKIDSLMAPTFDSIYIESYEKLKFYEINADLQTNIQTQVFLIIILIIIYYSCALLIIIIDAIKLESLLFIGKYGYKLLIQVRRLCCNYQKEFRKDGVKAFLIANCWDLFFTCFLQLKSSQSYTTFRSIICLLFAYLIFYGCLLILRQYIYKNELIKQNCFSYWISKMDLFFTLKKLIFIFILVCFQKNEQIQTILLTFVCNLYLFYAIKFKPAINQQDYCNLLMMEGSAFMFTLTSSMYWSQMSNLFTYDTQVLLGWGHIVLLLSVLIINLLLQIITLFQQLKMYVKKKLWKTDQKHFMNSNPYPLTNLMEFKL